MTDQPPIDDPRPAHLDGQTASRPTSLVMVNTGDGKGKSTAAFGTMLRSRARGWPVGVFQFLKSDDWKVGEEAMGRRLGVDWWALGDGFTWDSDDMDQTQAVASAAWAAASAALCDDRYRLVILDEITYPMNWGWIDTTEVVDKITNRHPDVNVIATGRDAPDALCQVADTVTEMRKVRHAYDRGVLARRGLDY